jgi:multidrug efflux system outer membrane protein
MMRFAGAMVAALVMAGCTLAPDYHRPTLPVSASFPNGAAYHSSTPPAAPPLSVSADSLGWRDFLPIRVCGV